MELIPQVDAIVFRSDRAPPRVLLVRAKQDPDKWIFPKGHIAPGESHADAVPREPERNVSQRSLRRRRLASRRPKVWKPFRSRSLGSWTRILTTFRSACRESRSSTPNPRKLSHGAFSKPLSVEPASNTPDD